MPGLMTVRQCATALGHRGTEQVYRAIKHGRVVDGKVVRLACVKVLGRTRIHADDLDRFIAECNPRTSSVALRRAGLVGGEAESSVVVREEYPESGRGRRAVAAGGQRNAFDDAGRGRPHE